jgi:hypothetical protein
MSSHLLLVKTRLKPLVCVEERPSLESVLTQEIAIFRAWRSELEPATT